MKKHMRFAVAFVILFGLSGYAHAVIIDFGPGFGAPVTGYTVLTNQLSSYGVTFSTTDPEGVLWWGGNYAWPPGRYSISAGSPDTLGVPTFIEPIRVDFAKSVIAASIRGLDGGSDIDTLTLNAYDSSDTLVDTMSITNEFSAPGFVASVYGANISYITFEVSVRGDHGLFFDDLSFTPVPLPGAVWLFASGLIALFGYRRKQVNVGRPQLS